MLIVTRRNFNRALATAALTLAALYSPLGSLGSAVAQDVDATELAKAPPLGDVVLGPESAPVTIVEYASMSCGHCAAFHKTMFPAIRAEYIDTGRVRFVFREFPLDLKAAAGSMVARCIGKNDPNKYHEAVSTLFAAQDEWVPRDTAAQLRRIARQSGLDDNAFNACIGNQDTVDALKLGKDHASQKLNVNSTPTFFVNGTQVKGVWSLDQFRQLIEAKLKS
jgi:protein-disulfide isomerase